MRHDKKAQSGVERVREQGTREDTRGEEQNRRASFGVAESPLRDLASQEGDQHLSRV